MNFAHKVNSVKNWSCFVCVCSIFDAFVGFLYQSWFSKRLQDDDLSCTGPLCSTSILVWEKWYLFLWYFYF